jgi:alanyl-tRNA synthetase
MQSDEVRKKYLDFFKKREHAIIPSSSLVPENDPTTLFTGSGMQPMLPFLRGEDHPLGIRVANSQKCFRAEDIEEVGDNRHTTFFEMLGNWSFGDYFNQEQLPWIFEFLTEEIGLDPSKLYVTIFSGDGKSNLPRDTESAEIWKKLFAAKGISTRDVEIGSQERGGEVGMQGGRIFYYDEKKNWWSRSGVPDNMPAGEPGGPDSEMFYDFGTPHDKKYGEHCHPNCDCGRFMEIGNNVFMKYKKISDGTFEELPKKNVDFGGGLERITAAANNNSDMFAIDTLGAIIKGAEDLSGKTHGDEQYAKSFRIIANHLRGAVFMIGDGIVPSNTEAGYFVRRLLRRAVRHMDLIGMKQNTLSTLVPVIVKKHKEQYPNLLEKLSVIEDEIQKEEEKFRKTLKTGLKRLDRLISNFTPSDKTALLEISGKDFFDLFQTYGFPVEMTIEEIKHRGFLVDDGMIESFNKAMKKHQELSQTASAGKFKGGLADSSQETTKLHTAAHLFLESLRRVLGGHVHQKGSNITAERLRLDFSHPEKMTDDEKKQVEDMVNDAIKKEYPVVCQEMTVDEAKKYGAEGVFESKYGEKVKVYSIGSGDDIFSKEICVGPHVGNTRELGYFRIKKEKASSAGVRRIKAVLE